MGATTAEQAKVEGYSLVQIYEAGLLGTGTGTGTGGWGGGGAGAGARGRRPGYGLRELVNARVITNAAGAKGAGFSARECVALNLVGTAQQALELGFSVDDCCKAGLFRCALEARFHEIVDQVLCCAAARGWGQCTTPVHGASLRRSSTSGCARSRAAAAAAPPS